MLYLHLLERVQLFWPVDLDMCNMFRRERDIEELVVVCFRHFV